jgi:ComF family protein
MSLASMFHRLGVHRLGGRWVAEGLDVLIPPRCVHCHGDLPPEVDREIGSTESAGERVLLCSGCRRDLASDSPRCTVCGERLGSAPACIGCRRRRHDCAGLAVLGGYRDHLRTAILRCKRPGAEPLVVALAGLLVARHHATFAAWAVDLVVPVPMHWSRRMVRGTSAADELAAAIAGRLGLPCRASLRRAVATRMQNEFPIHERRRNVADAFQPRAGVAGRTILLVDDVCTTGATLAACRQGLLAAGASGIYAAVVAKADRSSDSGDD